MQYRFYLDGNPITENPIGWDKMVLDIERSNEIKGVFSNVDATLTFTSDGYDYLKSVFDGSGYCDEVSFSAHQSDDEGRTFIERYTGLVYVSKMLFDDFNCSVQAEVTDNSFYGRINRRKSTPMVLTGESTVNGEALDSCQIYPMHLFDPATGTYVAMDQSHGCFRVYDVLNYMVRYMSDDKMEFDSPVFSTSGDFAYLFLTFGYPIRQLGNGVDLSLANFIGAMPDINFADLFKELDRRMNLGMYIDTSGAKPKLIIDYWKETFRNNQLTTFTNLPNLKTEIASEYIYSKAKFGGPVLDIPAASFPETIRFVGFNSEEFAITGKCPEDNTLDLSYEYVSSSNIIEQILILSGTDTSYDRDWFLIDSLLLSGVLWAKQTNWLTAGPPYYYNEVFNNSEIAKKYIGFVPNAIAKYLGNADNSILAEHNVNQNLTGRGAYNPSGIYPTAGAGQTIRFNTDSPLPLHDVNNLWTVGGPTGDFYTVPNTGIYSVGLDLRIANGPQTCHLTVVAERRDSTDTTLLSETIIYDQPILIANQDAEINDSALVVASATDLIKIKAYHYSNALWTGSTVISGARVFIDNIADGGGIYQSYDPADYPIVKHTFTTEISQSQTDAILANPMGQINFYVTSDEEFSGWIDDVKIDEFKGTITATLLRARNEFGEVFPPEIRFVSILGNMSQNTFNITPADYFGRPTNGDDTTNKVFFFEVGKQVTVTIPATFGGTTPYGVNSFYLTSFLPDGSQTAVAGTGTSFTFIVEPNIDYQLQILYEWTTVGADFPAVQPYLLPPTTPGASDGDMSIALVSPNNPADYTFLWSSGEVTASVLKPAGDYTCLVTYTPGGFTTNAILFYFEMPNSETAP